MVVSVCLFVSVCAFECVRYSVVVRMCVMYVFCYCLCGSVWLLVYIDLECGC